MSHDPVVHGVRLQPAPSDALSEEGFLGALARVRRRPGIPPMTSSGLRFFLPAAEIGVLLFNFLKIVS